MIEKKPIITGINYQGIFAAQLEAEEIPEFTGEVEKLSKLFLELGESYKSMTGNSLPDLDAILINKYIHCEGYPSSENDQAILRKYLNCILQKLNDEYKKINNDNKLEASWKANMEMFVVQLGFYKNQCPGGRKECLMNFYASLGGGSSSKACLGSLSAKTNAFFMQQIEAYKIELVRKIVAEEDLGITSQHFQMNICAGLMERGYIQKNQDYLDNKEKDHYGKSKPEYYLLRWMQLFDLNALCETIAKNPKTTEFLSVNDIRYKEFPVYLYDCTEKQLDDWLSGEGDIKNMNYKKAVIAYVLDSLGVIEIEGCEGVLDVSKTQEIEDLFGSKGKKISLCDIVPDDNNEDLSSDEGHKIFLEVMALGENEAEWNPLLVRVDQFLNPEEHEARTKQKQKKRKEKDEIKQKEQNDVSIDFGLGVDVNSVDIIPQDDALNKKNAVSFAPVGVDIQNDVLYKKNTIKFAPEVSSVLIVAVLSGGLFCSFYYGGLIVEQEMIVQSFCGISTSLELLELGALTIAVPIGIAVIAAMISGVIRNKSSAHEI